MKILLQILKITGLTLGALLLIAAAAAGIYVYKSTHYWQSDMRKTLQAGFVEKQVTLPDGSVINYAEGPDNGKKALILIHGQTGAWQDYIMVLPQLSQNWHVYAVDCYGHGSSTHDPALYYLDTNGDALIWMINNVIKEPTVVSGHSSGGLLAAYVAAHGGENVVGAVLEDPPVFSTEKGNFERTFAYLDTYQPMHEYLNSTPSESWPAFYLRHCLWGRLYMPQAMPGIANYAQQYIDKHPDQPLQIFFLPSSLNFTFLYLPEYDLRFGDHFYDFTWHHGIDHATLISQITVPTVFIHAKDAYTPDGILMAASSDAQARQAVSLMQNAHLIELSSDHDIHRSHPQVFIDAVNELLN